MQKKRRIEIRCTDEEIEILEQILRERPELETTSRVLRMLIQKHGTWNIQGKDSENTRDEILKQHGYIRRKTISRKN